MNIGIFGGSFDPIHNGHINLARYALDHTGLDAVWLMVSPHNPLKPQKYLTTDEQRLDMARLAVEDIPGIEVSDFEFSLPRPSYTWLTLTELQKAYPQHSFRLIIGADNWNDFDKWKNPDLILERFGLIVYPRPGETLLKTEDGKRKTENVTLLTGAPEMAVSSTQIRNLLQSGASENGKHKTENLPFLPSKVLDYIHFHHLYKS